MTEPEVIYKVGLPNGHTWVYHNKRQAENASLIAKALSAMPVKLLAGHTTIGKYGQQSALARELGYLMVVDDPKSRPNHMRIYDLLVRGNLPRSPERQAKLREIAARVPEDWFKVCPCLAEHEAEHKHD